MTSFTTLLNKYREAAFSERDKGNRFERLMQAYLLTEPEYANTFKKIWLWNEFPAKNELGGSDTGIDLVGITRDGHYWAIQCKCFQESARIDKPSVDSFLATSSRKFPNETGEIVGFSQRLWISTTNHWGENATEAIQNQHPPVTRINLSHLEDSPVDWAKIDEGISGDAARLPNNRSPKPHQLEAINKTHEHFKTGDRGKLIMACGTGKTYTALRIAEKETGGNGIVLFLVPSIALLGQTLREWSQFAQQPINAVCICSDPEVSKKRTKDEDSDNTKVVDLAMPASTNISEVLYQLNLHNPRTKGGLTVVYSTYQSIEVIGQAQKKLMEAGQTDMLFDLIICDEAHRTTGVSLAGEQDSAFVRVHDNAFLQAKKRLYMTATPRLYDDSTKSKAAQAEAVLCSMDDPKLYGEEIYRIGFGEAVERDLLTDYKVLILTLNENDVPPAVQKMIADQNSEINADDASKLLGCINALSKKMLDNQGILKETDPEPMRRAVAFCQSIAASKKISGSFNDIAKAYTEELPANLLTDTVTIEADHIDGTMGVPDRDRLLSWLKGQTQGRTCRVLTNVRCLSEGVDVPSLDAVMFLSARNSQVDVVQSVGRVMRKAPGKKYGYIIIPVIVPTDVSAEVALNDNERYKVVWTVLNALRAHDDRFNATVNKIELNHKRPDQILVGRPEISFDSDGNAVQVSTDQASSTATNISQQLAVQFQELQHVVFARMVQRVGDRRYWEQWAVSVADIAQRQIERIKMLIARDPAHKKVFEEFLLGLHKNINPSITAGEAIEMLSQHTITKPVFDALFENYSFVQNNPMSKSMQKMIDLLEEQAFDKDTAETLQRFYESVRMRAAGIDNAEGKQRIIIELYDKFFKTAFPKMVEKLGIVYTPVEVVDFIIHSVNDILQREFGRSISDENIHLLDPFTGTGTFITRLLQSGLIKSDDLARKYQHEIHANEIVLLAYYIAAVNIENAYHDLLAAGAAYTAFEGICLTDTFQLGESADGERLFSEMFPQNSERVQAQQKAPLRVIIGNPPYSVGQRSANDNAQNQSYPTLEKRISVTYAAATDAVNKNSLYDSYIKAFRWSTDRLDPLHGGIICFVSNGAWLDSNTADGFRNTIENEFSSIYVFNLRGNARTSGEMRQKEAGNVFGSGSRTPVAISLLVKKPQGNTAGKAQIYYHDIGDYLKREDKLSTISRFKSFGNEKMPLQTLQPNKHGDWISHRNEGFENYISIDTESKFYQGSTSYFITFSRGVATARDARAYASNINNLSLNIQSSIDFYNSQRIKYFQNNIPKDKIDDFLERDVSKIVWNRSMKNELLRNNDIAFGQVNIRASLYRPFFKQHLYFASEMNDMVYQIPKLFPTSQQSNLVICLSAPGGTKELSAIITNLIPDLHLNGDTQCFPLYYYEQNNGTQTNLFDGAPAQGLTRKDAISDFILGRAQQQYSNSLTKEDIFYYVYGFLHSSEYRTLFANDLKKMLPRLPLVDDVRDFWAFVKAGRQLADLHLNYESVAAYPGATVTGTESGNYRVDKIRFPKKDQKDTIIYNGSITITNIPAKAYEYVVNGKSAIEWVVERYQVTTHKESGITNNPNDWATEHNQPRYILDLLLSVINVSVQTVDIVNGLPEVEFE